MDRDNCPLISVIIPIYNAQSYLWHCLKTVIGQTYRNLEIILIDDGSLDSSGRICDEFAKMDARVKVFHTNNNGVAAARNIGLSKIHGQYIGFVDSDDYINQNHFQILYDALVEHNADISISGHYVVYENSTIKRECKQEELSNNYLIVMNNFDALDNLLYRRYFPTSVWCKLFKADLLSTLRFPLYKVNEDLALLYRYIIFCEIIVFINTPTYYYYQKYDSLTHSSIIDTIPDTIKLCQEIRYSIPSECEKSALSNLLSCSFYCYFAYPLNSSRYGIEKKNLKQIIKTGRVTVLCDRNAPLKTRAACILSFVGMTPTNYIYIIYMFLSKHLNCLKHTK